MEVRLLPFENKVDDLENRLCRNNLQLVGLPEQVEGFDPVAFLESWLEQEFGRDQLSAFFVIEQAHRVPGRPLPAGSLLNYWTGILFFVLLA